MKIAVCDMCGSENRLFKAEVEGTILNVCKHCSRFGKIKGNVHDKKWLQKNQKRFIRKPTGPKVEEVTEKLVEDFSEIIKKKRESLNMKQEELAKHLNERLSIIHKMETGHFEPRLVLARKLEKFLKIKIIEEISDAAVDKSVNSSGEFTLGDFIKVRERK